MKIPDSWTFKSEEIAKGFDRHVREQLPWYDLAIEAIAHIARHYIPMDGRVYDIGASTGNVANALRDVIIDRSVEYISIEESQEMVDLYRKRGGPSYIIHADALDFEYEKFDVAICFLVMMFFPPARRESFLKTLRANLNPGGAIIIFDKSFPGNLSSTYLQLILWRLTLLGKVLSKVDSKEIIEKELSLRGVQRAIDCRLFGVDAVECFRFGEFSGWVIEG